MLRGCVADLWPCRMVVLAARGGRLTVTPGLVPRLHDRSNRSGISLGYLGGGKPGRANAAPIQKIEERRSALLDTAEGGAQVRRAVRLEDGPRGNARHRGSRVVLRRAFAAPRRSSG